MRNKRHFDYENHIRKSSENWIGHNFPEPFRSYLPWFKDPLTFWEDEQLSYKGVEYLAIRQDWGTWNGYVYVPSGHKYENVHYDDIPVSVHGGLTYAGKWDDQFVIGFDTNHMSDFSPWGYYDQKMIEDGIKNFKNLMYVLDQAQDLAKQIVRSGKIES